MDPRFRDLMVQWGKVGGVDPDWIEITPVLVAHWYRLSPSVEERVVRFPQAR